MNLVWYLSITSFTLNIAKIVIIHPSRLLIFRLSGVSLQGSHGARPFRLEMGHWPGLAWLQPWNRGSEQVCLGNEALKLLKQQLETTARHDWSPLLELSSLQFPWGACWAADIVIKPDLLVVKPYRLSANDWKQYSPLWCCRSAYCHELGGP